MGGTSGELSVHVLGLPPLPTPAAQGPSEVSCGIIEGCTVSAEPSSTEFDCHYDLTSETRVAADNLVALGPDPDLWPGSIVRANRAAAGDLEAVPVPLGSMRVASTLVGAPTVDVAEPSGSSFQQALGQILAGRTEPSGTAVGSNITVDSIFSEEDLSTNLGIDVGLVGALANLNLMTRSSTTVTAARVAVTFVQSYFQVSVDPHTNAADYFGPGVTPSELDAALAGDVPVYVRSVTYGRRVVAVFEDQTRTDSDQFALEVQALYGGVRGQANFTRDTTATVNETSFAAMVLGSSRVITSKDQLFAYLDEPPNITTAWPIGYTLQYPGTETPFSVGITTEVVTKTCQACGSSDPYSDARRFNSARELNQGVPISDCDSAAKRVTGGLLPPAQERWFKVAGEDTFGCAVDPAATLATNVQGAELCIFATCNGPTTPACVSGSATTDGGLSGCCTTGSVAQLTGESSGGLCPQKTSDDADVYVRIRLDATATACVPFDLTVHY